MRSVECQVAAAVAFHRTVAASGPVHLVASGPARLAGSGPQGLRDFVRLPADLDRLPAFAHLVRELTVSLPLLHLTGHSPRGPLYPTGTSS
ncbi:MAG: hypothetical protein ACXV8X_05305 [Candidatus Angelobacter sp.]